MTEQGVQIRRGDDRDVPAILELMKRSLGEGTIPRTPEFWAWKHRDNPAGRSPFLVAEASGELVSVRVFMRWTFHVGDREIPAVRAVDTATHPDFQGKGIFRKLTLGLVEEVSSAGVAFVYNTPNDRSRPGYLKMGWQTVGRISLWVRPRLRAVTRAFPGAHREGPAAAKTMLEVSSEALTVASLARLRGLCDSPRRYGTRLDRGYLLWRYVKCPGIRYRLASVDPERALVAFRVRQRGRFRELTLCDVLAERSSRGARAATATITGLLRDLSPDHAVCAAHAALPETKVLVAAGFMPVPRLGPILTVRPLNVAGLPDPRARGSWGASVGDLELF